MCTHVDISATRWCIVGYVTGALCYFLCDRSRDRKEFLFTLDIDSSLPILINNNPPLVQIMAWHLTGAGHYLSRWWFSILTLIHECVIRPGRVNLSPSSAAYTRQWIWSAIVQIMAWRRIGDKPLAEPMREYCQLDPYEQTSVKFESKY